MASSEGAQPISQCAQPVCGARDSRVQACMQLCVCMRGVQANTAVQGRNAPRDPRCERTCAGALFTGRTCVRCTALHCQLTHSILPEPSMHSSSRTGRAPPVQPCQFPCFTHLAITHFSPLITGQPPCSARGSISWSGVTDQNSTAGGRKPQR